MKAPPTWDKDWKKLWEWLLSGGYVVNVGSHKGVAREKIGAFIESLLTSREAAIRKEIGERVEIELSEVLDAPEDAERFMGDWERGVVTGGFSVKKRVLSVINPTP